MISNNTGVDLVLSDEFSSQWFHHWRGLEDKNIEFKVIYLFSCLPSPEFRVNLYIVIDDAEILTSEVHDPYARITGAWK